MENKRDNKTIICKKLLIKVASYIVVLSLIVSVFSINIYAEEPKDDTYLDTYAAHYFEYLTSNFGNNTEGTCTYVAVGMLLSFYDSYLNDKFVIDDYEALGTINSDTHSVFSPGIRQEGDWEESSYSSYDTFVTANADDFFHLKLIQIARDDLHLYDQSSQNQRSTDSTNKPGETDWSIHLFDAKDVIEEYFSQLEYSSEETGRIEDYVTIHISSYNDEEHINLSDPNVAIRNEMIEKVIAGIPVVYAGFTVTNDNESKSSMNYNVSSGSSTKSKGHSMVAFDYDEESDTLYFHTGWNSDTVMTDKEVDAFIYTTKTVIMWFEIDDELVHSCSNNYAYSTSPTTSSLCACQMYSGSSSHTHNYNGIKYNDDCHFSRCVCGKVENVEAHNLIYPGIRPAYHYEKCNDCTYGDYVNHEYIVPQSPTETGHSLKCACGATITEAHYDKTYEKCDDSLHKVYCECGYLTGYDFHSYVTVQLKFRMCSHCGYVMPANPGPGQVIMGEEDEEPTTE